MPAQPSTPKRNRNYDSTHREMIEMAVRMISEKGSQALSLSELARSMGINRTTVYYHFSSRSELLAAVKKWSSEQLAKAFEPIGTQAERTEYITRFVLTNPELIRLWVDDFMSGTDIRNSYPNWDQLVAALSDQLRDKGIDAEVYSIMLLTSAFIAPHVLKHSAGSQNDEALVRRFRDERLRVLARDGLLT